MNPKVDKFISKATKWKEEMELLRTIALDSTLTEDFKWGQPCYTHQNNNVVLIHGFKEYCALLFFKGALLKDKHQLLIRQTENVQSSRQIRFTDIKEITSNTLILKAYIKEALDIEKAGLKVVLKTIEEYTVPEEFQIKLNENSSLNKAFKALTPGRQRGYLFYFSQPKQLKTRELRIEKSIPQIMNGKGLND